MNEFIEFVNSHRAKAYEIELAYGIVDKLQEQQQKLRTAESSEEILEVRNFAEKAVKELKAKILLTIRNGNHLTTYLNGAPRYLSLVRMWFEYKELYEKTEELKSEVSESKNIKVSPEYENFFTDIAMLTDRNRFKSDFRKNYLKDPETIGRIIADFENDKKLRTLSGNFSRRALYKTLILEFDPLRNNVHKKIENDLNKAYTARKEEIYNNENNSANI